MPRDESATTDDAGHPSDRGSAHAQELEALHRALASALQRAQAMEGLLNARQRELEQLRGTLRGGLATLRTQFERVEESAAWRYGHAASRSVNRLRGQRPVTGGGVAAAIDQVDRLMALIGMSARPADGADEIAGAARHRLVSARAPTRGDALLLGAQIRDRLGPLPQRATWPSVCVVVVSRSAALAGALVDHLPETGYEPIEVVLVDNASPAGEVAALANRDGPLRVTALRLDAAASFAEACNRGARHASSELILFVNDDVSPLEAGWLHELVATLIEGDAAIAGATLVAAGIDAAAPSGHSGWTLEQRGIAIGLQAGEFAPLRRERGEDVLAGRVGTDVPAVAVSAACMLLAATTFAELGGFDSGYQYGLEDVDLCLRARSWGGAVLCSGRAVVVHAASSTQRQAGREFRRINRAINRARFRGLWGPALRRERLEGLLRGDPVWGSATRLTIARTSNDPEAGWGDYHTAVELGEAAAALGWSVDYLEQRGPARRLADDVDVVVVLTDGWDVSGFPASTLLFAWVRNWTERWLTRPWLDRYDVLLASSISSARILQAATGRTVELFPLATNPRRFAPPRGGTGQPALDWVFSGNRWGERREIEPALQRRDRGAIYGRGWGDVKALRELAKGPLAYDSLPEAYGSARVVLDDTATPALAYDAVNARVFDALACGVPVLTNCRSGVRELFDDDFPTWSSPEELRGGLERLLAAPARRTELASRYRETVLAKHTYEHRARRLRRLVREHNERLSFCLKVGAPDREQAERWGDLHLARGLGRALRRAGHRWHVDLLGDWNAPESSTFDVTVHLRGRSPYAPAPGQFNVLWLISHPEEFDDASAEGYDLVCVASSAFAARLRERVAVPVHVLEQATDPRVFYPDPDPALAHDLAFVGNTRGVRRKILDDLLPTEHDLAVWGGGWSETDVRPHVRGEHVASDELRRIYSSASVVLCDHWPDMRAAGFRSNRLYDALACGALVVSDRVSGLDGSLGDAVMTYEQPSELRALLDRLLSDPDERARRSAQARGRVVGRETFDERASELLAWVHDALGGDPRAGGSQASAPA